MTQEEIIKMLNTNTEWIVFIKNSEESVLSYTPNEKNGFTSLILFFHSNPDKFEMIQKILKDFKDDL